MSKLEVVREGRGPFRAVLSFDAFELHEIAHALPTWSDEFSDLADQLDEANKEWGRTDNATTHEEASGRGRSGLRIGINSNGEPAFVITRA